MNRIVATIVLTALMLAGCSNSADETTCHDFNGMDGQSKRVAIAAILKDRNHRNAGDGEVGATVEVIARVCGPDAQKDKLIKDLVP